MTCKSFEYRFHKRENCTTIRESDIQRHVTGPDIGGDRKPRCDFFVPRIGSHRGVNFNIIRVEGRGRNTSRVRIPGFFATYGSIQHASANLNISSNACPFHTFAVFRSLGIRETDDDPTLTAPNGRDFTPNESRFYCGIRERTEYFKPFR